MEPIFKTGNETVDRLSRLQITGNVIPSTWYRTIRKETGKPYLTAIVILSDIVYWYRAAEIRDEGSGQLLGFKKRFKADLLQRSYQQMSEQFGISKRDAVNAVVELEKLGVVKRVFRNLEINGQIVPNVLFLALDVAVLERLTFPEKVEETVRKRGCPRFQGDMSPNTERCLTDSRETSPRKGGKDITEISETNTENTYREYNTEYPIQSYQQAKESFKNQIEYDILAYDDERKEELDELVEIAVDVLTSSTKTIRVNREEKETSVVQEHYRRLTMLHIQYVLDCLSQTGTKARNIRAVMVTALYNASSTMGTYYTNLYQHMQSKPVDTETEI